MKVPSLQNHITQKNLTTASGNTKYKEITRTAEMIKQISTLLVLNYHLDSHAELRMQIMNPQLASITKE